MRVHSLLHWSSLLYLRMRKQWYVHVQKVKILVVRAVSCLKSWLDVYYATRHFWEKGMGKIIEINT